MKQGGVEDMEFPGVLKKEHVDIPGVNKKEVESPGVFKKNSCGGIFMGLLFWPWSLEFPRAVTQFCRIFKGESLFSPEFQRVKSQI